MNSMIHVGVAKETVTEAKKALVEILRITECGDSAKVAACDALTKLCQVTGTTISNCTLSNAAAPKATKKR